MMRAGECSVLSTPVRPTSESESGLWPTPTACMSKGTSPASLTRKDGRSRENDRLDHAVLATRFATPQARDFRTGQQSRWENPDKTRNLNDQIGGQLNPTWVEWLMGWPLGWTDCAASATDRFRTPWFSLGLRYVEGLKNDAKS
jgi:hypothetical protein